MVHQIESMLYKRQVLSDKSTNFETRLLSPQSELAQQTLKDTYIFDFVQLRENAIELRMRMNSKNALEGSYQAICPPVLRLGGKLTPLGGWVGHPLLLDALIFF